MRRTHFTIMLVCEGDAENELARVVRDLYLPRNCGTTLQHRNAHGHGGSRALDIAIQLQRQTEYGAYGILIDTDRHWDDANRAQARKHGITVIENTPCLEATLLQVDGQRTHAQTRDNKDAFQQRYGGPAHRDRLIERNFSREKFDQARPRVAAIHDLLTLIRC